MKQTQRHESIASQLKPSSTIITPHTQFRSDTKIKEGTEIFIEFLLRQLPRPNLPRRGKSRLRYRSFWRTFQHDSTTLTSDGTKCSCGLLGLDEVSPFLFTGKIVGRERNSGGKKNLRRACCCVAGSCCFGVDESEKVAC
ncbi:hypothetical protein AVEN_242329-1 [Araneus ventricosus]|uniref:Uncharacterized protein n=1 Tax=Araneus ventricosus TaxID=182803 RepID=A0A4Y2IFF7_ARAVE|nr:hypothetical protein AVEN_242329-1 [Araneus ventricosus]